MKGAYWFLFLLGLSFLGAATKKAKVDSVLDRLEQRLMEDDRETLSFGEGIKSKSKKADRSYEYTPETIVPRKKDTDQIAEIGKALNELESDIDSYSGEVQRLKQKILEDVRTENYIDISGLLEEPKATLIRSLRLKLDGYTVYDVDETNGLWMPKASLSFFRGPLTPGKHKLEIHANLGRRQDEGLPIGDDFAQSIQKDFDLTIATGPVKKAFVLKFKAPGKTKPKDSVELGEKSLE